MSKDKNVEAFKQKGPVKAFFCGLAKEASKKIDQLKQWTKDKPHDVGPAKLLTGTAVYAIGAATYFAGGDPALATGIALTGGAVFANGAADTVVASATGKTVGQHAGDAAKSVNKFVHKMVQQGR